MILQAQLFTIIALLPHSLYYHSFVSLPVLTTPLTRFLTFQEMVQLSALDSNQTLYLNLYIINALLFHYLII